MVHGFRVGAARHPPFVTAVSSALPRLPINLMRRRAMNSQHTDTAKRRVIPFNTQQHSGGAIIDAQGREIPITEVMIQRACRELDRSLEQEQKQA
ncbi:PA1571 family protein [Pseudomonas aeruginosa]